MKKFLAMTLSLVMALSLVACGSNDEPAPDDGNNQAEQGETIKIAVVLKTLSSEYWRYVESGCKQYQEENPGVEVVVVGPSAESEIEAQVAQIEQQLVDCDAIICAPNDAGAAANALQAALDAGKPVLSVDTNVGMEGQTSFIGTSNVDAAKQGGLWAVEKAGGESKAVIIYGQEGDNTSNMRREGYEAACAELGVEVLDALSGQNTTDGATKTMEDLLNAYPGQIDIVLCHNDDTAIGAMNACETAGVTGVTIVGFDGNKSAAELVRDGKLAATVAQQPVAMGYESVKAAVAAVKGEEVEPVISAPVVVVTAENVEEYLNNL